MLEPMELLIPIDPYPCAVTITDETASGIEVPAAKNVSPITLSGRREEVVRRLFNRFSDRILEKIH
jgi:hypothetical protein